MKVLFAVSNDNVTTSVINKYQQKYKEIVTSKNVYYFNAIVKELQRDKNYDAIIIEEDLEPISNNNYEAIDKFLFEKLDSISDEASKVTGEDIPIIFICSDRRTKSDTLLRKLFSMSIYNALVGNDRSLDQVCELMYKPRNKKEAKKYYQIVGDQIDYESQKEELVSEEQIQNILLYYKKIGTNERKCVQAFDSIAKQYDNTQLRIIVKFLPMDVKAILEMHSPVYQRLMANGTVLSNGQYSQYTPSNPKKPEKLDLVTKNVESGNKLSRPVVIPSNMNFKAIEENNNAMTNTTINQQPNSQPQYQATAPIQQSQTTIQNTPNGSTNAYPNQSNQYNPYNGKSIANQQANNWYRNPQPNYVNQNNIHNHNVDPVYANNNTTNPYYTNAGNIYNKNAHNPYNNINGLNANLEQKPWNYNNMQQNPYMSQQHNNTIQQHENPQSTDFYANSQQQIPATPDSSTINNMNNQEKQIPQNTYQSAIPMEKHENTQNGTNLQARESTYMPGNNGDINPTKEPTIKSAISESLAKEVKPLEPTKPIREETSLVAKPKAELKTIEEKAVTLIEEEPQSIETETETKRRRGRPRKVKLEPKITQATTYENETETSKKRRGRPRKKAFINDDKSEINESHAPVVPIPVNIETKESVEKDNTLLANIPKHTNPIKNEQERIISTTEQKEDGVNIENKQQNLDMAENGAVMQEQMTIEPYIQETSNQNTINKVENTVIPNNTKNSTTQPQPVSDQSVSNNMFNSPYNNQIAPNIQPIDNSQIQNKQYNSIEKVEQQSTITEDFFNNQYTEPVQYNNQSEIKPINLFDLDINTTEPFIANQNNISLENSSALIESKANEDNLDMLKGVALAGNGKVVAFVGTSKNGVSFIVNNLAQLLSQSGINTAVVDLTKNKNSYYMFTDNDANKVKIATESLKNLSKGLVNGLVVKNNLTVFTALPDDMEADNLDYRSILESLSSRYDVILLDCDFHTNQSCFVLSNEIYLVQSMDALTIQPLTKFLSDLKLKNILDENKIKIIINKYLKLKKIDDKTIVGGMSKYNEPSMTLQRDLFNPKRIMVTTVPFDEQTYIKYLESVALCQFSLNGYSKEVLESLEKLKNMVYPLISGGMTKNDRINSDLSDYNSNIYTNQTNSQQFTNNINDTLDKMRKNNY